MSSNSTGRVPKLRLHKPSGRGVVRFDGTDFYLGEFGSADSQCHPAEWLRNSFDGVEAVQASVKQLQWLKSLSARPFIAEQVGDDVMQGSTSLIPQCATDFHLF